MQEELRITFFVIGIVFIVGILVHGAWTIRKNKRQNKPNSFQAGRGYEPRFDSHDDDIAEEIDPDDIYDDVGVGQARVISSANRNFSGDTPSEPQAKFTPEEADKASEPATPLTVEDEQFNVDDTIVTADTADVSLAQPMDAEPIITSPLEHDANTIEQTQKTEDRAKAAPLYSGVVTQPKPEFSRLSKGQDDIDELPVIPDPPGFLLKKHETSDKLSQGKPAVKNERPTEQKEVAPDFSLHVQDGPIKQTNDSVADKPAGVEKELSFAEQAKRFVSRRKKTVAEKIRKEPVVKGGASKNHDQMRIDFESPKFESSDADEAIAQTKSAANAGDQSEAAGKPQSAETDVLVLNVRANAQNPIGGAALLPMLLTLGFKFGEHDIFHRHVNTNGKGPILFSLTNMFKPGVFDIDNIENFSTQGLSLFMMLPIEGEAQQVFNMMHNAARKIAEEFDCKILDGNKVLLSKQSLQQYSERIRDFERSRFGR